MTSGTVLFEAARICSLVGFQGVVTLMFRPSDLSTETAGA